MRCLCSVIADNETEVELAENFLQYIYFSSMKSTDQATQTFYVPVCTERYSPLSLPPFLPTVLTAYDADEPGP